MNKNSELSVFKQATEFVEKNTEINTLCNQLKEIPRYSGMEISDILLILYRAKALSINAIDALNGDLYAVKGKVEMSASLMAERVRARGHSVVIDKVSNDKSCTLHGKRSDNGDTCTVTFSVKDADTAGIGKYKDSMWKKYPGTMCYNRAFSQLSRRLFPDAIKNCYVKGEISDAPPINGKAENTCITVDVENVENAVVETIVDKTNTVSDENTNISHRETNTVCAPKENPLVTPEMAREIKYLMSSDEDRAKSVVSFIDEKFGAKNIEELTVEDAEWVLKTLITTNERNAK